MPTNHQSLVVVVTVGGLVWSILFHKLLGAPSLPSRLPLWSHRKTMATTTALTLPPIGLGTFGISAAQAGQAIRSAIEAGYRNFDCAPVYFNEKEIGDAMDKEIASGAVRREDLWITSKLASPFHRKEHVEPALRKTLNDLKVKYLDLYLMHWPVAFKYVPLDPTVRGWYNDDGSINYDIDDSNGGANIDPKVSVKETWSAMEDLVESGLVRNIGVSNFPAALLHELMAGGDCRINPMVNQVELHPYLQQKGLVDYCRSRGVQVQAYSPLGTPQYREEELKGLGDPSLMDDPTLVKMAREKGVSVAQLCLAWALQRGTVLNAKSASAQHQKENIAVLNDVVIKLSDEEMGRIAGLDRGHRFFRPEDWWGAIGAVFD